MKESSKAKKKNILLWISGILILIAAVSGIFFYLYVSDYYHADDTAISCLTEAADDMGKDKTDAGSSENCDENDRALLAASDEILITEDSSYNLIFMPEAENITSGFIFYPGGKVEYTSYAPLMCKLARKGILCILVHMPCNLAVLDINAADGIQKQYPGISHWYIGGHSLGGVCAAMYLENHADDYDGLILMGSYSTADMSGSGLQVLSMYGEYDGILNRDKYQENLKNLPDDYREYIIPGGCHAYFGNYGAQKGDGTPTITADQQQSIAADQILDMCR